MVAFPALDLDVPDVTDPDTAIRWLTDRYATGADRDAWTVDGTPMSAHAAVTAVLTDPTPPKEAVVAVLALRRELLAAADRTDTALVALARARGVGWEHIGASVGTSKQGAQQRHERRMRPRQERPATGGRSRLRAWLDENAARLRAVVRGLIASHHAELRAVSVPMAGATYRLGRADYQGTDADVLACARELVGALRQAQEAAGDQPWNRVRLSDPCWAAVAQLTELLEGAPE